MLRREGLANVAALLTTMNEAYDRVAMHGVRAEVLRAQAAVVVVVLAARQEPADRGAAIVG